MGYERNDRSYGRDAGRTDAYRTDPYRADQRYDRNDPNDRGFFERAGDEVRSWFGDEEAERRRRYDERFDDRFDRNRGNRDEGYQYALHPNAGYPRYDRSNQSGGSRDYAGDGASGSHPTAGRGNASGASRVYGRDLDHGFGAETGYRGGQDRNWRDEEYRALYENDRNRSNAGRQTQHDDPHGYHSWRSQQIDSFDRDYDEYRRENQTRFASEFSAWRENRQGQRNSLRQAREHQEVVGSDGAHVGTVDHVRGDRILLTKTDKDAGGHHHSIPSAWINTVDDKVHISKTADEAHQAWRDEETNRGLFGNRDQERTDDRGPADLNRSFSGTY